MKYGAYLNANTDPDFSPTAYIDYHGLKTIIKKLSEAHKINTQSDVNYNQKTVSMSAPPPTSKTGQPVSAATNSPGRPKDTEDDINMTDEAFFSAIDREMEKVENFTKRIVGGIREELRAVESELSEVKGDESKGNEVLPTVDRVGTTFLKLEKYVNLNFMGFHKILKKHDKFLPNKCKQFYVARMHDQSWVKGDYSDIVVQLSGIYSKIRGDHRVEEKSGESQSFMRSTTKYWVNTQDISKVKYKVLQNLPVFLQKTSTGETDSQLTNSVYLDNASLELYTGRLEKSPGAIALRLRWYGNGSPQTVFVERKTHRDSWTGEISVKERFIVSEKEVKSIMNGDYDIASKIEKMRQEGKSQSEIEDWETLVIEILTAINSKQLVPTMRTQYMRTAFQIPFDPTVRVSLDTNLCMISERGYNTEGGDRWHRDPNIPIDDTEIARFPHAVLEIKLEVKEGSTVPHWVTELQASGMLYEVHKFSKFIHGCATLLYEDVQSVPYWVDDSSLRDSIVASGASRILADGGSDELEEGCRDGAGPGANQIYEHLLPHGTRQEQLQKKKAARTGVLSNLSSELKYKNSGLAATDYADEYADDTDGSDNEGQRGCWPSRLCVGWNEDVVAPTSIQKVEPKVFFANERTFIHWLHMGVILSSVASGILAFGKKDHFAQWYAILLLPISLGFCVYALHTFLWRAERIKYRAPGRWDDPTGPLVLSLSLVAVLSTNFFIKLSEVL